MEMGRFTVCSHSGQKKRDSLFDNRIVYSRKVVKVFIDE